MASRDSINKVEAPALPIPPETNILRTYLDDLNNILRLFFNRLANNVNLLTGAYGGQFIESPNGKFFSTVDQNAASTGTAYALQFENTYLGEAISVTGTPKTRITPTYSGVYNFQFIGQVASGSASAKNIYLWITRNGTDLGYTAREFVLQGSGEIDEVIWNFNLDLAAGEYVVFGVSADTSLNGGVDVDVVYVHGSFSLKNG